MYWWSLNDGAQDFIAELHVNGQIVGVTHQQEPKDTGGGGPAGTDQRHVAKIEVVENLSSGNNQFELLFAGSAGGDNAAIYYATLTVERYV